MVPPLRERGGIREGRRDRRERISAKLLVFP